MRCDRTSVFLRCLVMCGVGVAFGCSGDTTGPAALGTAKAYWALRLNYHAVNLALTAPNNTVQLSAVPVNPAGDSLSGVGSVTYTTGDSNVVVTQSGLVTARFTTSRTFVIATLRVPSQNVTHADTVSIQVAQGSPLATFSIQPRSDGIDSAKEAVDQPFALNGGILPVFATDEGGNTVCNASDCALQVYFTSSDPTIALIDRFSGLVTPERAGRVTFYATTLAYGVVESDSLPFVVGYPITPQINVIVSTPVNSLTPALAFTPTALVVAVGGTVTWSNQNNLDSVDVVFDDSTAALAGCVFADCVDLPPTGAGNIALFALDTAAITVANQQFNQTGDAQAYQALLAAEFAGYKARSFLSAGTYRYHSRRYPTASGAIYVKPDP